MKRTAWAVVVGVVVLASVGTASACPPGGDGWNRPVADDRGSAASLLRQAASLEREATELVASARAADQRSAVLDRRAANLRITASSAGPGERRRLLEQAFDLEGRADDERSLAEAKREEATQLRATARRLRERVAAAGGGGGGWGIRPPVWRGNAPNRSSI